MAVRKPAAQAFYRGASARWIEQMLRGWHSPKEPKRVRGGLVPHAGWTYSGATAAKVYATLSQRCPATCTVVVFGAMHRWASDHAAVYPEGAWWTPLGDLPVDAAAAQAIIEQSDGRALADPYAHADEHSIEVQTPFLRYFLPKARFVPITVPPGPGAAAVGRVVSRALAERDDVVFVGSSDLTHYGHAYGFAPAGLGAQAKEWMRENDQRLLDKVIAMDADAIVPTAKQDRSACGAGAIAATMAACHDRGAQRGVLLEYTTSYDAKPEGEFKMAVGYAGVVFG